MIRPWYVAWTHDLLFTSLRRAGIRCTYVLSEDEQREMTKRHKRWLPEAVIDILVRAKSERGGTDGQLKT